MPDPQFFATPAALRAWFEANHASEKELRLGYYKVGSGKASVTWPQSVDEALCFGWIDGVRRSIDKDSYVIRFTPRKAKSSWSRVNVGRFEVLVAESRMTPAGVAAFEVRPGVGQSRYSFEQDEEPALTAEQEAHFRANKKAWAWFEKSAPSYRKSCIWWLVSAKQEVTKERRLTQLIEASEAGTTVAPFTRPVPRR